VAAEAAAAEAAGILFGGDPAQASADALRVVAREVPTTVLTVADLADLAGTLSRLGLAKSNGEARRTLAQKGYRANGQVLHEGVDLVGLARLHGRYLLLQRGRTTHHLVDVTG
jgi:tyrosyl-tRNA synthetase